MLFPDHNYKSRMKSLVKSIPGLKQLATRLRKMSRSLATIWARLITTRLRLWQNSKKLKRFLEIGPGKTRINDFETLNIVSGPYVDYVCDAAAKLPFNDNTFDVIYASHILEHVPWYKIDEVLEEWVRIVKADGILEVWVPDGLKICKALVDFEESGDNYIDRDGWYKMNPEKDPCVWAAGRLFTYGDGDGNPNSPNWHRSVFTFRYLQYVMKKAGLKEIRQMNREQIRSYDHGWINLGIKGIKP